MNSRKVVIVMVILILGIIGASLLIKPSDEKTYESKTDKSAKNDPLEEAELDEIREAMDKMDELYNLSNVIDGDIMKEGFRKGINMGDMLEAPNEGDWGVTFDPEYFRLIKEQGFDFVRLPIKWSAHLNMEKYLSDDLTNAYVDCIEPTFLSRVDYIINCALENELGVVINVQNFYELTNGRSIDMTGDGSFNVAAVTMLNRIWAFLSIHYKNMPDSVLFEILGEPYEGFSAEELNFMQTSIYSTIRSLNPKRGIILQIGYAVRYNNFYQLHIPKDDKNVIISFQFYEPTGFTLQETEKTKWTNDETERKRIDAVFNNIKSFAEATGLPVFLGEFGTSEQADTESRIMWTRYVRETAEKYGFTWCYWEFCSDFGIFDRQTMTFNERLTSALIDGEKDGFNTEKGNVKVVSASSIKMGNNSPTFLRDFEYQRKMDILCGDPDMLLYDTNNNTQIVSVKGASDGGYVMLPLTVMCYNVNGSISFGKTNIELTVKNLNDSITDLRIALCQGDNEAIVYDNSNFAETEKNAYESKTTLTLKLDGKDSIYTGFEQGLLSLKLYIETVPERKDNYDRLGSLEFVEMQVY